MLMVRIHSNRENHLKCDVGFLVEEEEDGHLVSGDLENVSLHLKYRHSGICSLTTDQRKIT